MKKTSGEKGITLVALIITIIVLLILAVVTIRAVQGDGIIRYAQNAADLYREKADEEEKLLDSYMDLMNGVESVESLQQKHQFSYYSTLSGAVADVNNDTIGINADVDKEEAVAGIYTENGKVSVVLLKDTTENNKITLSKDMTINLGGKTLTIINNVGIVSEKDLGTTVTIDGRNLGSTIILSTSTSASGTVLQAKETSTFIVNGGKYIINFDKELTGEQTNIYVINGRSNSNIVLKNCELETNIVSEGKAECKVFNNVLFSNGNIEATNCNIKSVTTPLNTNTIGVFIAESGFAKLINCNIFTDAPGGSASDPNSTGVFQRGTATITNCYVYGTHSGISTGSGSKTYVTSGTIEGPGHGGFYFSHGATGEAYIEGAKINKCEYKGKYENFSTGGNGGLYIGSSTDEGNHMIVNFNNCEITNPNGPAIVLSSSYGGTDNTVRISNSTVSLTSQIRIDSDTHSIYYSNCNFTKDNTNRPDRVFETNETYVKE